MSDLEGIRAQALEVIGLTVGYLGHCKDDLLEGMARKLEAGAPLLPITDKGKLMRALGDYEDAASALAAATSGTPDLVGLPHIDTTVSRARAMDGFDALKRSVSFCDIRRRLEGNYGSDEVSEAIRGLMREMAAYDPSPAPKP